MDTISHSDLKGFKQKVAPKKSLFRTDRLDKTHHVAMFFAFFRSNSTCKGGFFWHFMADFHNIFLLLTILLLAIFFSFNPTVAQSSSTDGESNIIIDLPAEQVFDVVVTESLPVGLIYLPETLAITGASANPKVTLSGPNDGSSAATITWSFGNMNNSANQDIQIKFRAVVANVDRNQDGAFLAPGSATLSWKDTLGNIHSSSDQTPSIKVIEPDLQIKRQFSPARGWRGDTVSCTLNVLHSLSSTADAYDVDLQESLPQGLSYVPDSMEIVNGPAGTKDDSNGIHWHFSRVDRSWSGAQKIQLRYKATIDSQVRPGDSLMCLATLDWTSTVGGNPEVRQYSITSEDRLMLTSKPSDLKISLADNPDPVRPGGILNYTISYLNKGGYTLDTVINANYDPNLAFISASPSPDQGTDNLWTLGDLDKDGSGTVKVTLQANSTVPDGSVLTSSARISSSDGANVQASASTSVSNTAPSLFIENSASDQLIRPGGTLKYTIDYRNAGSSETTNVTVTDIVDPNLLIDAEDASPWPSKIWSDGEGTHLYWNATTLNSESFAPGASGQIEFQVSLPSVPEHPDFDRVYNHYKIDSNETEGDFNVLDTFVVHSLYIRKKADKDMYLAGEVVNYTILYGNELAVDAEKAVIYDVLPNVEYMDAEPAPNFINGNILIWNMGTIPAKTGGEIQLYAKVKENLTELNFWDKQSVSGYGYVNLHRKLSTSREPNSLTNYANITAYYLGVPDYDESSASIKLADAIGTEAKIEGHGSGSYSREDQTRLLTKNKTIEVKSDLSARYGASSFKLPGNRSIDYISKWSEADSSKNLRTGASINERYMYATSIDREGTLKLDQNGSTLIAETSFEGAGHIGALKRGNANETSPKKIPVYDSREDYRGSFKVFTKVDEYGENVVTNRSVSGVGYVAVDKRLGKSQRSYESGTGSYQAEDHIETQTSYIAKDLNVSYQPVSYSYTPGAQGVLAKKWSEGMWSRSGTLPVKSSNDSEPASFIGEEFSQADYLKKNTTAKGLNEMDTEADFSGRAQFKSQYVKSGNQTKDELSLYDEYVGKYKINRKLTLSGVARFDEPHLSISKVGSMDPAGGSFIYYVITVVNDGNRALGPIYVLDLFPPGTEYVYSSLRPSELASNSAQWTLVNLGIGSSSTIELKLNATEDLDNLVNSVQARGGYNDKWVSAQNYSALQLNWLSCCPPQLRASKTGYVDANDSMLVHYKITLKNRERYIMAANINDDLPGGMMFINSTVLPLDYSSGHVRWNIIDLKPGEVKVIDYLVRALQDGVFVNQAHIEATSVNGSDSAFADVSCLVQIGSTFNSGSDSNWKPPACFGLNCTLQGTAEEWIPCPDCGSAAEYPSLEGMTCVSCTSNSEEGYEIP
jgi:uncharacterized repeat protein (TIGR01451 family)